MLGSCGRGVLLAVGLLGSAGAALAQADPTVDSLVNALRPPSVTRGIRPVSPVEVGPGSAAPPPSVDLTVQFANDSARLTRAAPRTLDVLGSALTSDALARYRFRIEGHTDAVGSRDHNQVLSEARAKAVVTYLAGRFHVDTVRLEPVGMGEDGPLVPARANVPEPRNRRVTVVNLGT